MELAEIVVHIRRPQMDLREVICQEDNILKLTSVWSQKKKTLEMMV